MKKKRRGRKKKEERKERERGEKKREDIEIEELTEEEKEHMMFNLYQAKLMNGENWVEIERTEMRKNIGLHCYVCNGGQMCW